jgi:cytochrome d ubiquinol oxidase subunit II
MDCDIALFVIQQYLTNINPKGNLLEKRRIRFSDDYGILGPVLLGTAVGTFFNGAEFTVNKANLTDLVMPVISSWDNPLHGLEAVFVVWNVCLGLAVFFLARIQALLYFINNINDAEVDKKARKRLIPETILFLIFFLAFLIHLLVQDGFAVNPESKEVFMQPYKYFINLIEMPVLLVVLLLA